MFRGFRIGLAIWVLGSFNPVFAQPATFGNPLNIPPELSGSFAELRANHFHGGVDFKTQQREGLPVYAVADGTLSRVVVSASGYGKALYISHANGMMSVYAHLSRFIPDIERLVNEHQYAKKSFETDFHVSKTVLFKKGDLIGFSGNTGSSGGPHLHFELRNKNGENAVNPALYGYRVKDDIPPIISMLAIYPDDRHSVVEGLTTPLHLPVKCKNGQCSLIQDTIRAFGHLAFGIEAIDKSNESANELGLYAMKLFVDDELKFAWKLDGVLFSQTRYINAFIDYAHYDTTGTRIQWTYRLPGNHLNIYEKITRHGVFPFLDNRLYNIRIEAFDIAGNTRVLDFVLRVDDTLQVAEKTDDQAQNPGSAPFFSHTIRNTFETEDLKIVIPPMALYQPLYFDYAVESSSLSGIYSNIHHVHHSGTPLHTNYTLTIKTQNLPKNLENKALIASLDPHEGIRKAEGGKFNNGFVSLNIRKFSIFAVCIDTTNPTVKPIDVVNNHVPASQNVLTFRIEDDFSGIGHYAATLNGQWFLMEYDAKTKTLKGSIDGKLPKGKHEFTLTLSDKMNNRTTYTAQIIR